MQSLASSGMCALGIKFEYKGKMAFQALLKATCIHSLLLFLWPLASHQKLAQCSLATHREV